MPDSVAGGHRRRAHWRSGAAQITWPGTMRTLFAVFLGLATMAESMANEGITVQQLPMDGWRLVTDGVMGGVSRGEMRRATPDGQPCVGLRGQVSTENNGGFLQIALDVDKGSLAAADYDGIRLQVMGNGERYNVHLRTADLWLPWQSYRASFETTSQWQEVRLPFAAFEPYKTGAGLDVGRLRRIGIVAIGRDFAADVCVREAALYRAPR
jgi:hypothetical protein